MNLNEIDQKFLQSLIEKKITNPLLCLPALQKENLNNIKNFLTNDKKIETDSVSSKRVKNFFV